MATELTHGGYADRVGFVAMTDAATDRIIVIARDFSRYPGGRYKDDGEFSGEAFREDVLVPALNAARDTHTKVVVDIDGAAGYPASFLEEAFGGLVRERYFSARELGQLLKVKAGALFDSYRILAERYIREAKPRALV